MDNSRCVILVPVARHIEPHCALSLRQLEERGYPVRRLYGFAQIDAARNLMATEALGEGFEELMWIDSDIAFEPGSVDQLRSHGLPLVCGLYPKKVEKQFASHFLPGQTSITFGQGGGLLEILYAAAGFLLVRCEVFHDIQVQQALPVCNEHLGQRIIPYFLPMYVADQAGHRYLSEDFSFCERARRSGYRIVADTTIRLQHIGIYGYGWEDVGTSLPRYSTFHFHFPLSGGEAPSSP
jgi:hypothetical protein